MRRLLWAALFAFLLIGSDSPACVSPG